MTNAILDQVSETLSLVHSGAGVLARSALQIREISHPDPRATAESTRLRAVAVQTEAVRTLLTVAELARSAGQLSGLSLALRLAQDEHESRLAVARATIEAEAVRDVYAFLDDADPSRPSLAEWADESFEGSWQAWGASLGIAREQALAWYMAAFRNAVNEVRDPRIQIIKFPRGAR